MSYLEVAINYSIDIISNEIPSGTLIKLAAQRFLNDLDENSPYFIDEDDLNIIVEFCQSFDLTEVYPPRKTELQPWQIWILANVWCIKSKDTLMRKYRVANISVGRGNAKTQLVALLCIYELLYGHDAQIILASNTTKQTMEVDYAKLKMLCLQKDPRQKHIKIYYNKITYGTNRIIVTSNEAKPFDGLSGSLMCLDEMHLFDNTNIYGTLRSSMIKRNDNIMFIISTAGLSMDTDCYKLCQYSEKVLFNEIKDDTHFAAVYTIDADDRYAADLYDNDIYIKKANPMLGVSVQSGAIKQELQVAKHSETDRVPILVKHLNLFHHHNEENEFIPYKYITQALADISLEDQEFKGQEVYCGVDLSENDDISAVSYMIKKDDVYYFFTDYFICRDALTTKKNRERYREAAENGFMIIQETPAVDYDKIIEKINERNITNPIKLISYDKYRAGDFVKKLNSLDYYLLAFSQLPSSMNRPLREIQRLFLLGKIKIQDNPITTWMFSNVITKQNFTGLVTIDKSDSDTNKIDGVSAMADALGGYLVSPEYGFNVW